MTEPFLQQPRRMMQAAFQAPEPLRGVPVGVIATHRPIGRRTDGLLLGLPVKALGKVLGSQFAGIESQSSRHLFARDS